MDPASKTGMEKFLFTKFIYRYRALIALQDRVLSCEISYLVVQRYFKVGKIAPTKKKYYGTPTAVEVELVLVEGVG